MAEEVVEVVEEIVPETILEMDPETGRPYQDVALEQGWEDPSESDDAHHRLDAKTFVERGRQIGSIRYKQFTELQKSFDSLKGEGAILKKQMVQQEIRHQQELETRELKAVEDGDVDGYKAIQEEKKAVDQAVAETPVNDFMKDPAVQDFISRNTWYESDRAMTLEAMAYSDDLRERASTLTVEQNLARTEAHIKQEFPHKFEKKKGASPVESGRRVLPKGGKKTYEAMPEAFRKACDESVHQNWTDRDGFVKNYWSAQS